MLNNFWVLTPYQQRCIHNKQYWDLLEEQIVLQRIVEQNTNWNCDNYIKDIQLQLITNLLKAQGLLN